ncbi:hypothetical protein SRHO_G00036000 [Serrasalmus rhombeus]
MSSSAISSELAGTSGTQVYPFTVRRSLARSGLHGRDAAKKPYLRHGNKAKRLNYARKHRNWGAEKRQQGSWAFEEGQPSFYHVQILHYTVLHSCLGDDSYLASKRRRRTSKGSLLWDQDTRNRQQHAFNNIYTLSLRQLLAQATD